MNGIEFIVIECLKQKKWESALLHLNQLLDTDGKNETENEKLLAYLLWRSQCFFEMNCHDACIRDCKRIMDSVPTEAPRNNFWFKSRWRLVHSLIVLKDFKSAIKVLKKLVKCCTDFTKQECIKLLERIRKSANLPEEDDLPESGDEDDLTKDSSDFHPLIESTEIMEKKQADPMKLESKEYFCFFCNITCKTVEELHVHCQTQSHQHTIMSDEGRDWKKRPPPRGMTADTYNLCGINAIGDCPNGAQCVDAHSVEELNEWKERFEYRMMKLQRSNEALLYGISYTELVLNKLSKASDPGHVVQNKLIDIEEEIQGELTTIIESKISDKNWSFTFRTTKILKVVSLLYDSHRSHFSLQRITTTIGKKVLLNDVPINTQEWTSRLYENDDMYPMVHKVDVSFSTHVYGTFRQTILFDFGNEPFLIKNLCVDVVPVNDAERIKEVQQELVLSSTERWEQSNCIIIPFFSVVTDYSFTKKERELLSKYFVPTGEKFTITQAMLNDGQITKNNYRSRMHELLYIEEMAYYDRVAKFSVRANIQVVSSYILSQSLIGASTAKFSTGGELFAMIALNEDVSEDSPGGRLLLNNCATVLLSDGKKVRNLDSHKPIIFEAVIEDKCKNVVYLRLSAETVTDLELKPDTSVSLEIQFQLNRIPFCEWHQAVDCVSDYRIIFPDLLDIPEIPKVLFKKWTDDDWKLNEKQREAVAAIVAPRSIHLPPVLIIGPFGTGKTYTLAQAVRHILSEQDTKILICTHSNSAADLYIKEYLHPYVVSGLIEATPLRIYYHKRWVSTVNSIVLEYCLTEVVNGTRIFKTPQLNDILRHRIIVVTLNISSHLSSIGLPKGYFTHILLDEAAQAMECEAIMPLALANEETRIVLAGDHMQLSPEIFSQFAREKKFHISLLQRLYESYPAEYPCKIVLCENYRAHKAIVEFMSALFYDGKLLSLGKQPRHHKFYPLTFFTALGEDVQDINSTGFYNSAEVYEVVERVADLKKNWPECWGKFDEYSIGIMTPYPDQVYRIRLELKKRKLMGISVERVLNVQGKQFRVVFLSTVRTARTCVTVEKKTDNPADYDYGFLSNKKLLNTAVTRAQSLVAVVGDPVSLCSIGKCRKIWEHFIEICSENASLFGISWQDLKSLLLAVEMKRKYKLNPLAPEFIPRSLQVEPYLQFLGTPLMRSPSGIQSSSGTTIAPCNINGLPQNRVYTYDNIRYELPPTNTLSTQLASTPNPLIPIPNTMPSPTKWNRPPSPLQVMNPIMSPLSLSVNTSSLKSTVSSLRSPPGFSPMQMPSSPVLYSPTYSGVFPNASPQLNNTSVPYVSSSPHNSISSDTNIPLQLTLIPLSQYMRTHPPPAYTNSISKTFSPPIVNLGNTINAPNLQNNMPNGYKQNIVNGMYVQNIRNEVKYPQDYSSNHSMSPNINPVTNSGNIYAESDIKNILPPHIPLAEMLRNADFQAKFIDLISVHMSKENSDNMQRCNIEKMKQKCDTNAEFVVIKEPSIKNNLQINNINDHDKEYESPDDLISIPLNVHLPSSLLRDLLPSTSDNSNKRRGPLYKREPSQNTLINGEFNKPGIPHNSTCSVTEFPKNIYQQNVKNNVNFGCISPYVSDVAEASTSNNIPNGELSRDFSTNFRDNSLNFQSHYINSVHNNNSDRHVELQTKEVFYEKHETTWTLMSNSYSNDDSDNRNRNKEYNIVNSSMTYAAALRQSHQKFSENRTVNEKLNF